MRCARCRGQFRGPGDLCRPCELELEDEHGVAQAKAAWTQASNDPRALALGMRVTPLFRGSARTIAAARREWAALYDAYKKSWRA